MNRSKTTISIRNALSREAPPDLHIRAAGPADAEIVHGLVRELSRYEHLEEQTTCSVESLREAMDTGGVLHALLAFVGDEVAGLASYFRTFSTFAGRRGIYLEDLIISDAHRGQGIATALMRRLAQMAAEEGCGRIEWTVLLWNTDAIEFFESIGAKPSDAWTTYRLDGEWFERLAADAD